MSPAPRVVLLDSCAYFRLARSIHPLLAESFGPPPPFSLFVLAVLEDEYLTSSRLKNKFEWVNAPEFRQDRAKKKYACKGVWAKQVDDAFSYLAAYVKQHGLMLAREDLRALSVGFVRQIVVVSDDRAIRQVAEAHAIECWGSLQLLKLMVDFHRIDRSMVIAVLEYWDNKNDLPMGKSELQQEYRKHFGEDCPV